ncbi:MAG: gluconate 2-dehydrogenase subunit 3 family protein [Bacteroidales bacterium]
MINQSFSRREFVRLCTGGTAAVLISFNTACKSKISNWRYLDEDEITLLDSIVEQIIPTDDFPGGKWANVSNFIDKQLDTYYRNHQLEYREGLAAFKKTVILIKGKKFEELPFAEQTSLLENMEAGKFSDDYWKDHPSANFFEMVRQHSLQGFYGSLVHGGNRGFVSYRMLGLDYPKVIGQNRYNDLSWRKYNPKSYENGK